MRTTKFSRFNGQTEISESFIQLGILEFLIFPNLNFLDLFRNSESQFLISEPHILTGDKPSEENINSFSDSERHSDNSIRSCFPVKTTDEITEIIKCGQIVFHHDYVVVAVDHASDCFGRFYALFHVQVGRGLVEHVDPHVLHRNDHYCSTLQFSSGQLRNVTV